MSQIQKIRVLVKQRGALQNSFLIPSLSVGQTKRLQSTADATADQHATEWEKARPLSEVPTVSQLGFLLNYLPGGKYHNLDFMQLIAKFKELYGEIFYMPGFFGKDPIILSFNPDEYEKVFRTEGVWPTRRSLEILQHYRTNLRKEVYEGAEGLITSQNEEWGKFRSTVNPALMQPRTVKPYVPRVSNVVSELIERIKDIRDPTTLEVPDNFEEEINRYTLESVSVVALDKEFGLIRTNRDNPEALKLFKDLTSFFRLTYEMEVKPSIWKYIKTAQYHEMISALDGINDFVGKHVQEAIERLEKSPNNKPESEKGVLEKLLKVDKKIASVMAMDMLMAGVDTTSSSITGILLCLSKNPDKQQKLRDELKQVLPQKDSPLTEENLVKLPYLRAVIKESLRVYPLTSGTMRKTKKNVVLSGYRIPKGTDVSMVNFLPQKDPKYFAEPEKFIPERWMRRSKDTTPDGFEGAINKNPFAYLPFGFGARMCVGRRIADLEMEIVIARIVRNFNVEFNYPTEKAFKSYIINVPAIPLKFKFTDLSN